jgi:hypothetical protein
MEELGKTTKQKSSKPISGLRFDLEPSEYEERMLSSPWDASCYYVTAT